MQERLKVYEEKMNKSYDALLNEYTSIRAGRANPHVLDKIKVDYYGAPTPLQQVANISVPEPRMILIQPSHFWRQQESMRRRIVRWMSRFPI